jgi:peptidyl-prolyl cis-trans isomerase SurA
MTDAVMMGRWAPVVALCWGLFSLGLAQSQNTAAATPRALDHIVALVNSDPITNSEFRQRLLKVQSQLKESGATPLAPDALNAQVLEQLVLERVQLQRAQELGLRVDTDSVDDAKRRMASQNGLSLEAFERRLQSQGISPEAFAFELREQLLLQRLRDREADARAKVSETEIDEYIAEQQRLKPLSNLSLHLAQVLLPVPAASDASREAAIRAQAEAIMAQARAGQDFAQLAKIHSKSSDAEQGGSLGLRSVDRLPELFVNATASASVGTVVGPVRSGAGFHVLKVLAREQVGLPDALMVQTRARHILLRPSPSLGEAQAIAQMQRWRESVVAGRATFEALARQHSQDGSAPSGGELGWASPGQFVPEFESAMDALKPGEVSPVVVSRFGVHLIRVDERRQVPMSLPQQRVMVRNLLRQDKARNALSQWLSDLRAQAFVEYREAPRP